MDPWEDAALRDALVERGDGRWAASEVAIVVPRQNGKGAILEARALAGLFLFGEELVAWSAHEFKTAQEGFRRVLYLIQNTPDLERKVARVRTSHGEEGIELRSRQRLRFVARSTGSGRGFTGDTVLLDEAYNLPAKAMSALLPTMSARPNPQLWYTSSAPLPIVESDTLRKLCSRGRNGGSPRLTYLEWCAPQDADLMDRAAWAQANPNLGVRITEEAIETELEALDPDDFARERLGIWSELGITERVIDVGAWAGCLELLSKPTGREAFAVDVAEDRAWSSIAVAAESTQGGIHVELVDRRPGVGWLIDRLLGIDQKWGKQRVAIAKASPAWSLEGELIDAGVDLLPVSVEENAQACGDLFDAVTEKRIRHTGQEELDGAVAAGQKRNYGDAWLWSRRNSMADISPLVAVTLAHWQAQKRQRTPKIW